MNPKNIIYINENKTTFIDWTDVSLSNPLSDVVSLYLNSWNDKVHQFLLKKTALKKIYNSEKLFSLNVLIFTGKFLQTLEDSLIGLNDDFQKKVISLETKNKLENKIKKAIKEIIKEFRKALVCFLDETYLDEKKCVNNVIEVFSDKDFVKCFFAKNKKELGLKTKIKNLDIKIFHKRYGDLSKRFIARYSFKDSHKEKKYIGKIRIFKNNNMAKKSYLATKTIWKNTSFGKEIIPNPLNYFDKYQIFFYENVEGVSFSELLKKEELSHEDKIIKIEKIAEHLAMLHKVNIKNISRNKLMQYEGVFLYLDDLNAYLRKSPEDYKKRIRKIIFKTKKEIKNNIFKQRSLIHGDFQIENLIFNGENIKFIDFDDCEINDPLIDVGNFLVQMYYGGVMGTYIDEYRLLFLEFYLNYNEKIKRKDLNKRLNLYIIIAKIKNIGQLLKKKELKNDDIALIRWDIFKMEKRLKNLEKDPLYFFKN